MKLPSPLAPRTLALALAAALLGACAGPRTALPDDAPPVHVDDDGLALDGFDPVAYHVAGEAVPGDPALTATHGGATYRFADAEHRERFLAAPERYVPAYGGWCAWALADGEGSLVDVDPLSFVLQDGRLLLFYDGPFADTRARWLSDDVDALADHADENWSRLLRER